MVQGIIMIRLLLYNREASNQVLPNYVEPSTYRITLERGHGVLLSVKLNARTNSVKNRTLKHEYVRVVKQRKILLSSFCALYSWKDQLLTHEKKDSNFLGPLPRHVLETTINNVPLEWGISQHLFSSTSFAACRGRIYVDLASVSSKGVNALPLSPAIVRQFSHLGYLYEQVTGQQILRVARHRVRGGNIGWTE
jgi:hypothetical protein